MVVCKFFQQGNCRFGKNCRNEHIYGSKYTYYANPSSQPIQSVPAPQQSTAVTDEQLVNQVQSDIQTVLHGGQWILSCYSPYKEKPIFPGILDLSPEEARLFIYEAKSSNNLDQAVTYMNNLFKESRFKYEQLMQPNVNIINVLRSLYKGEIVSSPFSNMGQNIVQQNAFSNSNNAASSIFRSAVGTSPLTSPNANNAQSIFSQAQNSIFNTPATDPAKQIFSQASNQNVFGPSQSPGHIFALQNQNPDPKSIFATAVQGNYNTTNQNQSPSNIFAAANQSVFTKEQNQNTSPFNQGNVFKTAQNPSSVFGQAVNKVQMEADPSVYSKMEELSDIDLEAYKSDSFEFGFIPELPPPPELCSAPTRSSYFN